MSSLTSNKTLGCTDPSVITFCNRHTPARVTQSPSTIVPELEIWFGLCKACIPRVLLEALLCRHFQKRSWTRFGGAPQPVFHPDSARNYERVKMATQEKSAGESLGLRVLEGVVNAVAGFKFCSKTQTDPVQSIRLSCILMTTARHCRPSSPSCSLIGFPLKSKSQPPELEGRKLLSPNPEL